MKASTRWQLDRQSSAMVEYATEGGVRVPFTTFVIEGRLAPPAARGRLEP